MIKVALNKKLQGGEGEFNLEVSFELEQGDLLTITGPSGAGKTSILRMITGLMKPGKGVITVNADCWEDTGTGVSLPPNKRRVGFVFQDYALFPNMTVEQNIAFARDKKQGGPSVDELLYLMQLKNLRQRKPLTLSGGQQQRVALARALVRQPQLLLLDEPLSALDAAMRIQLQEQILKVHREFDLTTILVSHDLPEIFKMSDKVIRLNQGKIISAGTSREVYAQDYVSGKFRFTGELLEIEKEEVVYILSVLVGNNIIRVVGTPAECAGLHPGDKLLVASKAFNPLIMKIEE